MPLYYVRRPGQLDPRHPIYLRENGGSVRWFCSPRAASLFPRQTALKLAAEFADAEVVDP